jgi:hypothetical protein
MFFGYETDFENYSSRAHEDNPCTSFCVKTWKIISQICDEISTKNTSVLIIISTTEA